MIDKSRLAANLAAVQERIRDAARKSGREASEVKLVAVTKYVTADVARALVELGALDLGESRPQELWYKAEMLADLPVRWHLIGHLQRNKLRRTLPFVSLLHSADSPRILAALEEEAGLQRRNVGLLLEVNISGEPSKTGMTGEQLHEIAARWGDWPHLRIAGLMGMASREGDDFAARLEFESLRRLRDELRAESGDVSSFPELSMGMSGDFEIAIAAGATLVRIGSALFEGIE